MPCNLLKKNFDISLQQTNSTLTLWPNRSTYICFAPLTLLNPNQQLNLHQHPKIDAPFDHTNCSELSFLRASAIAATGSTQHPAKWQAYCT